MASWNPVQLPTEIKELIIDELDSDLDGFTDDAKENRAALCSCLFVSRQFHQRARRYLFRSIKLNDAVGLPQFRKHLVLLHQLMKTPADDYSLGVVSYMRKFSVVAEFGDSKEDTDEDKYGDEESPVAKVLAKYLPGILKLLMTEARGLQHFHMEHSSEPGAIGYDWTTVPSELRSAVRAFLIFRPLRCLELRNFTEVPNDFFHQTNVTHLITDNFNSMDLELNFDDSPSGSSFHGVQLSLGPVETLDTDQCFPIHRMVDMSRNQSSQANFLKNIMLSVLDDDDFNQVIRLLHAASLVEDLLLNFTSFSNADFLLGTKLDFSPLQKLTNVTLIYSEQLITSSRDSVPQSLEHASTLLKSSSSSIVFLTLAFTFDFRFSNDTQTRDDIIYQPNDDHWKPLDNALSGPLYPMLRRFELHINLNSESSRAERRLQASLQSVDNLFKTALPLLYASELLHLYID
ncbi:hypothetical protein GALMADRAFT_144682 [Galerina marginata CBS 339.88]|uniref:F-box domain-containing protein n=1 Tax=Galerina marginata (strain CBS 339.88) TaxID=685588 RepID=A0A067SUC9_GALM3|nr:hypothetical protein GALMADRAFT_144682 [Galerina marginata CBS 339.88]